MRFLIIVEPGQKYGPCRNCDHGECQRLKEIAISDCHLCCKPIGFKRAYCFDADQRQIHFNCLSAEITKQALTLGVKQDETVMPIAPLVFDKPTAANLLCLGVSTLESLIANNEISRVKIGTRVLFLPQHLTDFLKRREVRSKYDGRTLRAIG